jgi:mRNA interferase MazF
MLINQFEVWLADLNPQIGTEAGKIRPVVIVQTNLLNTASHPSTVVCPLTTNVEPQAETIRVHLKKGLVGLNDDSDVLIDQIRAIDNTRLIKKLGKIPSDVAEKIKENIQIILDL